MNSPHASAKPIKKSRSFILFGAMGFSTAAAFVLASATPAQSADATFDFSSSTPANNGNTLSFTSDIGGIGLTVSSPAGGPFPSIGGLNQSPVGLCSWLSNNNSATRRCNYTEAGTEASTLTGYQFVFDKDVLLKRFDISQVAGISSGLITFTGADPIPFTTTTVDTAFANPLFVAKGSPLVVTTSAILSGSGSGVFRINNLEVTSEVPAPLPLLGAGTALAFSRRLRKRVKARSLA
jgi:hypothetical protein